MEYSTSINEMNRRKIALRTLSLSFFLGVSLVSAILFSSSLQSVIISLSVLALILLISNLVFDRLFEKSKLTTIILNNNELQRKSIKGHDSWKLRDICAVIIKRTSRDLIREIRLKTIHSGSIYINGLEEFEGFANDLTKALSLNAPTSRRIKEPIDYDNPLFYLTLGAILGSTSALSVNAIQSLQITGVAFFQFGVACFILLVALFWFFSRPIAGRYGQKAIYIDTMISALMFMACLYMIFLSRFWQVIALQEIEL